MLRRCFGCCDIGSAPPSSDRARLIRPRNPATPLQPQPTSIDRLPLPPLGKKRKRALLIGINYLKTDGELQGCWNDVKRMQEALLGLGWTAAPDSMLVLTDEPGSKMPQPTRANMLAAMRWLVAGAAAGDALFFHFSGHGGQQVDTHGDEEDGYDETVCPLDFATAGQISDDELFDVLVRPLPSGVRLTALLDCCHSGHGMDFPYTLHRDPLTSGVAWNADPHVNVAQADVILLSGCEDDECSADAACERYGLPAGAMTSALLDALAAGGGGGMLAAGSNGAAAAAASAHTYPSLLATLHQLLEQRGFGQRPQVSSTFPFALERRVSLDDALMPASAARGPVIHVPRPPCTRRELPGSFGEMLVSAEAAGLLAGALLSSPHAHHHQTHHSHHEAAPATPTSSKGDATDEGGPPGSGGGGGASSWFGSLFGGVTGGAPASCSSAFDAEYGAPMPAATDDIRYAETAEEEDDEGYADDGGSYDEEDFMDDGDFDD